MKTILYSTSKDNLDIAAKVLAGGGSVAFPTETVYGLGADAFDPNAAKKVYEAKGRPSDNPLIVHISQLNDINRLVPESIINDKKNSEIINKLSKAFWPGPLTIILPKSSRVPKETTGGLDTVAIRMPDSEAALYFIEKSGTLVAGPSANISGRPSPTSWKHVFSDLNGKIEGIICGEDCKGGIESTVLDLSEYCTGKSSDLKILRPGLITPEMIAAACGLDIYYDNALLVKPDLDENGNANTDANFHPKAPGMKYKHYSPKTEMVLASKDVFDEYCKIQESAGKKIVKIIPSAQNLYSKLREADEANADLIICRLLDDDSSESFSIMNRALKAAGYKTISTLSKF